jgi:adenine phosphoribosyltransferase
MMQTCLCRKYWKYRFYHRSFGVSVGSIDFGDYIASYPDFPKTGILFRDISPLLASAEGMAQAADQFAAQLSGFDIDLIAGIESRGFLFSTLLASRLNIGSMMVRKPGKLPGTLVRAGYDLEYGTAELTIQQDAPIQGRSVLIIDDLLATGGTMLAAKTLLESCGAIVPAGAVVIELVALGGRAALDIPLITLKAYDD